MELNNLTPGPGGNKKRKRVGRGPASGHGKTCGRGHKGQKSRSGYSRRPGFEGGQMPLMRRLPKRGFHHEQRHGLAGVNLDLIDQNFEAGAEVNKEILLKKHLIKNLEGGIKILGRGEITKQIAITANAVSEAARAKIEAAGGTVAILPEPQARACRAPRPRKKRSE